MDAFFETEFVFCNQGRLRLKQRRQPGGQIRVMCEHWIQPKKRECCLEYHLWAKLVHWYRGTLLYVYYTTQLRSTYYIYWLKTFVQLRDIVYTFRHLMFPCERIFFLSQFWKRNRSYTSLIWKWDHIWRLQSHVDNEKHSALKRMVLCFI